MVGFRLGSVDPWLVLLLLWVGCLSLLRVVRCSWNSLGVGVGVGDVKMRLLSAIMRGLAVSACPMSVGCRLIPVLVSGRCVRRVRLEAFCAFGGLVPVSSAGDYSASVSDY